MTNRQENKLSMYKAVKKHQDENSSIVATIAELERSSNDLGEIISSIETKDTQKVSARRGKSQDKLDARNTLVDHAIVIAGALFAFGKKTKNNEMIETGSIAKSELSKFRDAKLTSTVEVIRNKANSNASALIPFGVSTEKIELLSSLLADYNSAKTKRDSASGTFSGANATLTGLFKDADELLKVMDRIMEGLKKDHKEFFVSYFATRVIKDLGKKRTKQGAVNVNATVNIFSSGLTNTTQLVMKNTGKTELKFYASDTGLPTSEPGIKVTPGKEVTAALTELGGAGSEFLNVTNLSDKAKGRWKARRIVGG